MIRATYESKGLRMRYGSRERLRKPSSPVSKAAVLIASPSLVVLTSYDVPAAMSPVLYNRENNFVFRSHGLIIESKLCDDDDDDDCTKYLSTIIAPAILFKRTGAILPHQVQFDVCLSDSKLYKGKLLACDFHYNLAAVSIQTTYPLPPATLKPLNDVQPIDVDPDFDAMDLSHSLLINPFQLRPHSNFFKVRSGTTNIIFLRSSFTTPRSILAACGLFRASHLHSSSCKELLSVHCPGIKNTFSGTIINLSGEVMGIVYHKSSFLPSNFISRWWNHYKTNGKICRPQVGVGIINLAEARLSFLEKFRNAFTDIRTGVVVIQVEKDSPAYCSGIRVSDVIVKCGRKQVHSKIEFFESMWDNAGKYVELTILRASVGRLLDLNISIGETPPTKFYRWKPLFVSRVD